MMLTMPKQRPKVADSQLISNSQDGDQIAYGQLVERYQNLICSVAYNRCGDLSLSEDLAQEAFLLAWEKLSDLQDVANFKAWICTIVRNLATRAVQRKSRSVTGAASGLEDAGDIPDTIPTPDETVVSAEQEGLVWRALENVPENYREPMILFYREEQSVLKVAEALELSEDAVKQRLSRGRRMLQQQLAATVESTLAASKPSKFFTTAVIASIASMSSKTSLAAGVSATTATVAKAGAASLAKSSIAGVAGSGMGVAFLNLLVQIPVIRWMRRVSDESIRSDRERKLFGEFYAANRVGLVIFIIAAFSSIWWQQYFPIPALRPYIIPAMLVLFYIPMLVSARRLGQQVQRLRAEEGTDQEPRPLFATGESHQFVWNCHRWFSFASLLVIMWPVALFIRVADWTTTGMLVASAMVLSLGGARLSVLTPSWSLLYFQLCSSGTVFLGLAFAMFRQPIWIVGGNDFQWFFIAMSGMATTAGVLSVWAWKQVHGRKSTE